MQNLFYLTSGANTILMSGEMDSLTNNSLRTSLVDFNNSSGYPMAEVQWSALSGSSFAVSTGFSVWFLRGTTSGTYETGSSGVTPSRNPDVVIPLNSGVSRVVRACRLPPKTFRTLFKNDGTGVTLLSSGNVLTVAPYSFTGVSG